eukprot:COSAG01_NODE_1308_length_10794_cov_4.318654_3_plen_100_part_00
MWWSREYDCSDHTAACRYLGLDDCWAKSRDEATGTIVPDPKAFPEGMKPVAGMCPVYIVHIGSCTDYVPSIDYVHSKGMKPVADYVHSKGLKFGTTSAS